MLTLIQCMSAVIYVVHMLLYAFIICNDAQRTACIDGSSTLHTFLFSSSRSQDVVKIITVSMLLLYVLLCAIVVNVAGSHMKDRWVVSIYRLREGKKKKKREREVRTKHVCRTLLGVIMYYNLLLLLLLLLL